MSITYKKFSVYNNGIKFGVASNYSKLVFITHEGQPTPTTITFTIDSTEYTADVNMTWEQWVNSTYNTDGYEIDNTYIHLNEEYISGVTKTEIIINEHEYDYIVFPNYLCFTALEDNCGVGYHNYSETTYHSVYYSKNRLNWSEFITTDNTPQSIILSNNEKLYIKGNSSFICEYYSGFYTTNKVNLSGDLRSMLSDTCDDIDLSDTAYVFDSLFGQNEESLKYSFVNVVNTSGLTLGFTQLGEYCYNGMFNGCTSLVNAPVLPATTLANYCYRYMFNGCIKLSYVKCLATSGINQNYSTTEWMTNAGSSVSGTKTFEYKNGYLNSWPRTTSGIPSTWTPIGVDS